jgi:hypothetical protein
MKHSRVTSPSVRTQPTRPLQPANACDRSSFGAGGGGKRLMARAAPRVADRVRYREHRVRAYPLPEDWVWPVCMGLFLIGLPKEEAPGACRHR